MSKVKIENIVSLLPDLISKIGEYFKGSTNELLKSVDSSSGSIGFLIKLFGKPLIDKYFDHSEKVKLENYGVNTYLQASLIQVGISLNSAILELKESYSIEALQIGFEQSVTERIKKIKAVEWTIFFQPKLHPVVIETNALLQQFLNQIGIQQLLVDNFTKHYYDGIETQISETFGIELYQKHLKEIEKYLFKESESSLLADTIKLSKIGFKESENLNYEETYAEWMPVSSLLTPGLTREELSIHDVTQKEQGLAKITDLIEEYFQDSPNNHLEKILFLVADFGKGKSVFLRHYAAKLAKEYATSGIGYIPVYFNLRNYKDFSEDNVLGVLGSFLEIKHGIKLNDEYFSKKRYFFLLDSLDECGELSSYNIDKVISSVKKVQNINPTLYKTNKIIIASRPFDDGLKKHLENHRPKIMKNDQGRSIEYYISLYGFKMDQFNKWLFISLKNSSEINLQDSEGLNRQILKSIANNKVYDIFESLVEREIISTSELKRPIFAYMIFQLISNSINFDKAGKIGIYLSFINLLTKEAKYLHDINYKVNLTEQFEARNVLHATAAIWLYNRNNSDTSEIKKADICRTIEGEGTYESDTQILARYKESKITEVEFLSHSYFGEKNNTLHFQHQSFAEILLAEYYLKILIKYSLDEEFAFEQARIKFSIGNPTLQTIQFLKELVLLFKESTEDGAFERRKLLFPLIAALSTKTNNKTLHSNFLFYSWFSTFSFEENDANYPTDALKNWPFNKRMLDKMIELCRKILSSENNLTLQSGEFRTSLFNKEVFFSPMPGNSENIDKSLALLFGNLLYNDANSRQWFNSTIEHPKRVFQLLKNYTEIGNSTPWALSFWQGFDLSQNQNMFSLSGLNLLRIDLSYSKLRGLDFSRARLNYANFSNCIIEECEFKHAVFYYADFSNTKISHYSKFALSSIGQGLLFPSVLAEMDEMRSKPKRESISLVSGVMVNDGAKNLVFADDIDGDDLMRYADFLGRILRDGILRKVWTRGQVFEAFKFKDKETRDAFRKRFLQHIINK